MAHLPARRGWRLTSLSVSYRAPAEVMDLAANVLAVALPGTVPPEPVRHTGHRPRVISLLKAAECPRQRPRQRPSVARSISRNGQRRATSGIGPRGRRGRDGGGARARRAGT